MDVFRDNWEPGSVAAFEYHCTPDHDSEHAEWWYRSHQMVTVLGVANCDDGGLDTFEARAEACLPRLYTVRWADGFEGDCFEDELLTGPEWWESQFAPGVRRTNA